VTKPQLAQCMLAVVQAADVFGPWVTGDEVYGSDPRLQRWLEDQKQLFVLAVCSHERLWISTGVTTGRSRPPTWQRSYHVSTGSG
jgi:SRSO17 transposase